MTIEIGLPTITKPEQGEVSHDDITVDQLIKLSSEAVSAAQHEPGAGFKLESTSEDVRSEIRRLVLKALDGDYESIQTNAEQGLWQVKLPNGSIIRVSALRAEDRVQS